MIIFSVLDEKKKINEGEKNCGAISGKTNEGDEIDFEPIFEKVNDGDDINCFFFGNWHILATI